MISSSSEMKPRLPWIDNARGFIMLIIVLSAFMPEHLRDHFRFFMRHSDFYDYRVHLYDLGLSGFMLLLGVALPLSLRRRQAHWGGIRAYFQLTGRYLLLIGIGVAFQVYLIGLPTRLRYDDSELAFLGVVPMLPWHPLAALGTTGLVTLGMMMLRPWIRLAIATILATGYQVMFLDGPLFKFTSPGGQWLLLPSLLGFPLLMLFGTVISEHLLRRGESAGSFDWSFILNLTTFSLVAWLITYELENRLFVAIDSHKVSASFIALDLCIGSFYLAFFLTVQKIWGKPIPLLSSFGKNTFICFMVYLVAGWAWDHTDLEPTYLIFAVGFSSMCALVLYLDRRNLILQI